MDWIHCNHCFAQPSKEKPFLLSNCGHMYCKRCIGNGEKTGICKVCNTECSLIQLVPDMKAEVKEFFVEPEEILTKLTRVLNFQKQHRRGLTTHWISLNRKYMEAKAEIKRLHLMIGKIYGDMKTVFKENNELKSTLLTLSAGKNLPLFKPEAPVFCSSAKPQKICTPQSEHTPFFKSNLVTPLRVSRQRNLTNISGSQKYPMHNSACSSGRPYGNASTFMTPPADTPGPEYKYSPCRDPQQLR